jgi:nucleoside-diphosphate-sugar epimerase
MVAMTQKILITGAFGKVGRILLDRDQDPARRYVLLDETPDDTFAHRGDVDVVSGSITDASLVERCMSGVTDVIHLAGISVEDTWDRIAAVNITGTKLVFDSAARHGVRRVILASSNHAAGMYRPSDRPGGALEDDAPPRPDTFYGWSKAASEQLLQLYCERGLLSGVSVRIGHCFPEPLTAGRLPLWLSPRDARALVDACLAADLDGYHVMWGVSANDGSWLSAEGARAIGFRARDNSAQFAERFAAERSGIDPDAPLGGHFTSVLLGEPMRMR